MVTKTLALPFGCAKVWYVLDAIDRKQGSLKIDNRRLRKERKAAQDQAEKLERENLATSQLLSNAGIDMRQLRAKHGPKL